MKPEDQSYIQFEIIKHPITYTFRTELLVEPNVNMFPEGYIGIVFENLWAVHPKKEGAPMMLYRGTQNMGYCVAIGNTILDVFLTKDGYRLDSTTHDSITFHKRIMKGMALYFDQKLFLQYFNQFWLFYNALTLSALSVKLN